MIDKHLKGVNINFLNTFLTVLTTMVFCFILLISNNVDKRFSAVRESINKFIICEQSSKTIKETSNYLTEQARQFVVTRKTDYAISYVNEINKEQSQQRAINELQKVCSEKDLAFQRLQIAQNQAESLIQMELYAMRLTYESLVLEGQKVDIPLVIKKLDIRAAEKNLSAEEIMETAINNLFGDGFLIYKTRINENCDLTVASIEQKIEDELGINSDELGSNLHRLQMLFCALLVVNIFIFVALAFLVLNPLKKFETSIKNDEKLKIIGSTEFKSLAKSYNEIYEIKAKSERNLLINAEYDSLTKLLNRNAFDQICLTSSEKKQSIALLLIDMDNFKLINDSYGHSSGDIALRELAKILKETFRKDDYIARIGGDEFAVVMQDFKIEAANRIVEKINEINEKLFDRFEDIKQVSISVGAAYSDIGYTEDLYKNADKALYAAKESGRRCCKIYNSEIMG